MAQHSDRTINSPTAVLLSYPFVGPRPRELYLTSYLAGRASPEEGAHAVFTALAAEMRRFHVVPFQERIFLDPEMRDAVLRIRREAYGPALDDGLPPTLLAASPEDGGYLAGVQLHALPPGDLSVFTAGDVRGRTARTESGTLIALPGVSRSGHDPQEAARLTFAAAERCLAHVGASFRDVARTWVWLRDILSWYDDFNRARTTCYADFGVLRDGVGEEPSLPASTGIGVSPANGARLSLDVLALLGGQVSRLGAAGNQRSAFRYGSAFARAALLPTPAGATVLVSGTASIDSAGRTEHVGDPVAQIRATLCNVRAVLRDCGCGDSDVVHALAYCKSPAIRDLWLAEEDARNWPFITLVADICRDDLLFEVEVTALLPAPPT